MRILGVTASSILKVTGSYESIASSSPTSGSAVTLSSIPSTYKHLQLRVFALTAANGGLFYLRLNGDSGTNYTRHLLSGDGSSVSAIGGTGQDYIQMSNAFSDNTYGFSMIIDIHDYASTSKYKTVRLSTGQDRNGAGTMTLRSGLWLDTSAISSLSVTTDFSTFSSGTTISLYGIKGA
jgi:hypothetical protein